MKRRSAFSIACLAALLCSPPAGAQTPKPGDPTAVQLQILEASRKANELQAELNQKSLELIQKVAQASIDQNNRALLQVQAMSSQAIATARETNDYASKSLTLWSGMLGALVVILGLVGRKEFNNLQALRMDAEKRLAATEATLGDKARTLADDADALQKKLGDAHGRMDRAVSEIELRNLQFEERVDARFAVAGSLGIDAATFILAREPFIKDAKAFKPEMVQDLFTRLDAIEAKSTKLADRRVKSWVDHNRALIYYYLEDFATAVRYQQQACAFQVSDKAMTFDRLRNLACMAARLFESTGDATALETCLKTLDELVTFVSASQAAEVLGDTDLRGIFAAHADRENALRAIK